MKHRLKKEPTRLSRLREAGLVLIVIIGLALIGLSVGIGIGMRMFW